MKDKYCSVHIVIFFKNTSALVRSIVVHGLLADCNNVMLDAIIVFSTKQV